MVLKQENKHIIQKKEWKISIYKEVFSYRLQGYALPFKLYCLNHDFHEGTNDMMIKSACDINQRGLIYYSEMLKPESKRVQTS